VHCVQDTQRYVSPYTYPLDPGPALGRLELFDANGPRAHGGIRALVIFKNTQCGTTQSSRADFVTIL
jgi:hypothetical protein